MKKLFTLVGLFFICSSFNFGQVPQTAPLNPEYIRYLELKEQGLWKRTTDQGYTLGYVPSPIEFITSDISLKEIKDLPSSFDLRNVYGQSYLTPVKHQGSCGSCWAFSTMAAIESRLLILDEGHYNLSENHLKQNHGFDWGPCAGGNHYLSTAYLSRGSGTILEADAPYYDFDHSSYNGNPPVMYHTDAVYLPNNESIIKQAIMDYGALYTLMRFEGESYDSNDYTHYYYGSDSPNHAVNIVGWDDNKQTAGGTGAWIVKNSWGINWGESGYFYIAYQDTRVNSSVAYWPFKIDYASNRVIDYYDYFGATGRAGYGANTGYALIKFVPDTDHELLTLGTYIVASGATVGFEVYDNFSNGNLSNLLGNIPNQTIDYAGYVTFELSTPIDVSAGNDFYVKVYYNTPDYNFPIPIEWELSDYAYPTIEYGVGWLSPNGTSWNQIGDGTDWPWNLCVKTYGLAPIDDEDPEQNTITFNVKDQHNQPVSDAKITLTPVNTKTLAGSDIRKNNQSNTRTENFHLNLNREDYIEIFEFNYTQQNQTEHTPKNDGTEIILPGKWAEAAAVGTYHWTDGDGNPTGWIFGNNTYGHSGTGMHFNVEETYTIVGAYFWISTAASGPSDVHFHINEFNGEPGNALASATVALNDVVPFPTGQGVTPGHYMQSFYVAFDNSVTINGDFFVGVDYSDLSWNTHGDGIGMASTLAGQGGGGQDLAWIKGNDGVWAKATSYHAALNIDVGVFPVIQTETEPIILYTDAGGQTSFQASDGDYTYTVEKTGHTSSDGEFTVSGADVNIHVTLVTDTDDDEYHTFHYETFGNGNIPAGWSNVVIQGPSGFPGWEWTNQGGAFGGQLNSTSASDGYMILDSDKHGMFGTTEEADLISPAFDFSSINTEILFSVEHLARTFGAAEIYIYISVDDFDSQTLLYEWSGAPQHDVNTDDGEFPDPTVVYSEFDITDIAAGESNVRIKFKWIGEWDYWWLIDDFKIMVKDYEDEDPGPDYSTVSFQVVDQNQDPVSSAKISITPDLTKTHTGSNNRIINKDNVLAKNISPQVNREGFIEIAEFVYTKQNKTTWGPKNDDTEIVLPGNWAEAAAVGTYRWTDEDGNPLGWIFGNNTYGDTGVGFHFNVEETYTIVGAYFWISVAASGSGDVHFHIQKFNGEPGDALASATVALNDVEPFPTGEGVSPDDYLEAFYVEFDNPVEVTGDFFVSVVFGDLDWNEHGDGIGMSSTVIGQGGGGLNRAFIRGGDGTWVKATAYNAALDLDLGIFPVIILPVEPIILYTDAGGQASFETEDGCYSYMVEKTGYFTFNGTFSVIGDDVNIDVVLQPDSHTIIATSSDGGSISPEGHVEVIHGENQTFTITPNTGFYIDDVLVDDTSIGAQSNYTFINVTNNHSIHANFQEIPNYNLILVADPSGSGTLSGGGSYAEGTEVSVSAAAYDGFVFVHWTDHYGNTVSNQSNFYYIMPDSDATLTAKFNSTTHVESILFKDLEIYPNPFGNFIVIKNMAEVNSISLTNLYGQTITKVLIDETDETTISTESLSRGIYLIIIEGDNWAREVRKIVKE